MRIADRRDFLRLSAGLFAACAAPSVLRASSEPLAFTLDNGFRVRCAPTASRYVSTALILRSSAILHNDGGLGHIMEHTSFTGSAGVLSAKEVKQLQKAVIQDTNATTTPGMIDWRASFLPKYLPEALQLLSITSLDQKFDLETVSSEAQIVLQELYLDKYDSDRAAKKQVSATIFGKDHPLTRDTTDAEIAKAKTPPAKLATELQQYAAQIRLPANMELFVVGAIDAEQVHRLAREYFGRYPFAKGPFLELPYVGITRAHHAFNSTTSGLQRPLSEIKVTWSTGVRITDPEAKILMILSQYLGEILFSQLREKHGDSYSPEADYEPNGCSGVFTVSVTSNKDPGAVEKRIFETIEALKREIDLSELERFRERLELKRLKTAESGDAMLDCMVARAVNGQSVEDLDIGSVSADDLLAAARRYLPAYQGGYVCSVLRGR